MPKKKAARKKPTGRMAKGSKCDCCGCMCKNCSCETGRKCKDCGCNC